MEKSVADLTSQLRSWAALGGELARNRSGPVPDWAAADRMIEAVRPKMAADAQRLKVLLENSRKKLAPLSEPFDLDFGLHRWLDAEREEAYSDWLEWVVRQAKTPARVFRLFGLAPPSGLCEKARFHVEREVAIPYSHIEREGRLDLFISYGDQAIIVIEVKKGEAEGADTAKHAGYGRWLEEQPHASKRGVFLAVSADEEDYDGFLFRAWESVCIEMRLLAIELCKEDRVTPAAMVLAFVAAVEQNLLGFSPIGDNPGIFVNPYVLDYVERFLKTSEG